MQCSMCKVENPDTARFCIECATLFSLRCPSCGAENPQRAKFCAQCSKAIAAPKAGSQHTFRPDNSAIQVTGDFDTTPADGERKTVTALFADIKGSTELMEDLDPEEARTIIDPALKLMIDAVRRYDGYIVQSTGDGIFALFGAPAAYEDHSQRALHAALRIQEDMRRYSAKLVSDGGTPLEARVGVNTGEVVVRSIEIGAGHLEYTPIGHTTNLASRMQAVAPAGSIAISEATRRLVEGYFQLRSRGPTSVKGVSEPVNVYEVTGLGPLRTRLQRSAGRGLTKFVGREREMEAMKHAAEQARAGRGQIVAAMAEPGVGKSRLFFEFKATSQSGWMVLETFSVSHGKASAYLPVIDLLRNYFDITLADDERKRREKVTGRVVALDRNLEDTLPYLFALLGVVEGDDPLAQMDGQVKKRRTLEAIKRILLRESLNQPLMVIFEDLHWIDEQTQEFLNLLADSIGTAKILLLMNYRPEYHHEWGNKSYYTQLKLDPLGKESAEEMLSALLGDGQDLLPLKRLIIQRTEGTPFFMEEIVQALFEDGVLQRNGAVKLARSMNAVKAPATVQAVLASRIDRLSAEEKELLQTLAVLGREFTLGLVRSVTLKPDDELERGLSRLQAAEFIYEQPATGDVEYIFKHALTQEVAYNSLLIERRKALHERAGRELESMFAGQLEDHLAELAHHYGRSENVEKAVEYLGRAGQQALQRSAYADAINRLTAAIDLLQNLPDSPERFQQELLLQLALARALTPLKSRGAPEVQRAYIRARELCERLGDPPELFPAVLAARSGMAAPELEKLASIGQGLIAEREDPRIDFSARIESWALSFVRGELATAHQSSDHLLRSAQKMGQQCLMEANFASGITAFYRGEFLSAQERLVAATTLYVPLKHRSPAYSHFEDQGIAAFANLALVYWHLGYPAEAFAAGAKAIEMARELDHAYSAIYAFCHGAVLAQYLGDVGRTLELADQAIAGSTEHCFSMWLGVGQALRGWALAAHGDFKRGVPLVTAGIEAFAATGTRAFLSYFAGLSADALLRAGQPEEAFSRLTEAMSHIDRTGEKFNEAELYRLMAAAILNQASPARAEALSWLGAGLDIARKQSAKSDELRLLTNLVSLSQETRRAGARRELRELCDWFGASFALRGQRFSSITRWISSIEISRLRPSLTVSIFFAFAQSLMVCKRL
jgi:class 3 adenylate cyclase/predicted ATPase